MNLLDIARAALADVAPSPPTATAPTPAQESELRALVARVAASWPEAERAEALAVALADPADALTSWRALAADMETKAIRARAREASPYTSAPLAERNPGDDRRTCRDCANLSGTGRCLSAWRGNPPVGAGREYHPVNDILQTCEWYAPRPDEPDQRSGAERWPGAVWDAKRRREMAARG